MQGHLLDQGDLDPAVTVLKACLTRALTPRPELDAGPEFDAATTAAVLRFQREKGGTPDGVVGPVTWALLGQALGYASTMLPPLGDAPPWVRNLLLNNPATTRVRGLDVAQALDLYVRAFGALSTRQREGLSTILTAIAADPDVTDVRWAAYMLATVKHECADRWQPIEEFGRGQGRDYGKPVEVKDEHGQVYRHAYYGRGYVQLTWDYNYRGSGKALGIGNALLHHPELALDPTTAYRIMSHGMRTGGFTGRKLAQYIAGEQCDYKNARRIINGLDQWERIQGYAVRLQAILTASVPAPHAAPLSAPASAAVPGAP
jgi:peptidoglycan hydrolase-like protein with peptidoglycan-binding domain